MAVPALAFGMFVVRIPLAHDELAFDRPEKYPLSRVQWAST